MTDRSSLSNARLKLLAALVVSASLLIGYLIMEAAYRGYLYYAYVVEPNFSVTTIDVRPFNQLGAMPGSVYGYYQPHKPIAFTSYDGAGRILERHTVQINNFGWPSRYDYSREKQSGEYRIAIVGDLMTASINNSQPWPDALQRNLNADRELLAALNVERISVLNLGIAGASIQLMANPLALIARRFSADMVIIDFIADDLRRRHGDIFSSKNPNPQFPADPAVVNDKPPPVTAPDLVIDGVGINLVGCDRRDLLNPACKVSPYFSLRQGTQLNENEINHIKTTLASRVFWSRIAKSDKPLLLLEALGRPAVARPPAPSLLRKLLGRDRRDATPILMTDIVQSPEKEAQDLMIAVGAIRAIRAMHKEVMLIHNPTYWYLTGQIREPAVQQLGVALKGEGLVITGMVKYLPRDANEREWFKWFNLPHDGHWSDVGAEIYGQAVYKAVREKLLAK